MEKEQATAKAKETELPNRMMVAAEEILESARSISERIAHKAYNFFEERGRILGHDLEDWVKAEFEIGRPVAVELRQTDDSLVLRAEVPGFSEKEIKVSVDSNRVLLSGKREPAAEAAGQVLVNELRGKEFCREVILPEEVDPLSAVASLANGIIVIAMKRVPMSEPRTIDVEAA